MTTALYRLRSDIVKETAYKFFTAVLMVLIFFGMLNSMRILSNLNDYNYIKRAAEKNSGLAAAGPDIPAASAKAPAEAMRTEPAPITAEDLSCIYIDGIKLDFPCTLANIREHFDTERFIGYYDEEKAEYTGSEVLMKNGVGSYRILYSADSREPTPEKCTVTSIGKIGYSEKYVPQLVIAGMDVYHTSDEDMLRLAALDGNEYLTSGFITYPYENDGYVAFNLTGKSIGYYKKNDADNIKNLESLHPLLIKTELRLPEDYDADTVPESKEELKKFALEYYACDDNTAQYIRSYNEEVEVMVNDIYLTAYEFMAMVSDEYNVLYYELTEIESLISYDSDGSKYDTGYLIVTADCYIEGYDDSAKTDMILKAGDRLGDALLIQIDL